MNVIIKELLTDLLIDQITADIEEGNLLPLSKLIEELLESKEGSRVLMSYFPDYKLSDELRSIL